MTLEDILRLGVAFGVSKARDWLADAGVTLTDELVKELEATARHVLQGAPGVTHAKRLEVDDQR